MESVFLTVPVIPLGFLLSFALLAVCFAKKLNAVMVALSMLVFIADVCYAALLGATLGELGTVSMVFFLMSAVVYIRRREGK